MRCQYQPPTRIFEFPYALLHVCSTLKVDELEETFDKKKSPFRVLL